MTYLLPRERFYDALTRIMEPSKFPKSDTKPDIYHAIADKSARIEARLGKHVIMSRSTAPSTHNSRAEDRRRRDVYVVITIARDVGSVKDRFLS